MKLDLTRKVEAAGVVVDPNTGQRSAMKKELSLAEIALMLTGNTQSYQQALKYASIREKAKKCAADQSFSDDEFNTITGLFKSRSTEEKLTLVSMIVELNPGFDVNTLN